MRILIVEDDPQFAAYLTKQLRLWKHEVVVVGTGHEALKQIAQNRIELILLDIFLPDTEGYRLIPHIYEKQPDVPIVAMTGFNSRETEAKIRSQGITYYLLKPIEIKHLQTLVTHLAARRHSKNASDGFEIISNHLQE